MTDARESPYGAFGFRVRSDRNDGGSGPAPGGSSEASGPGVAIAAADDREGSRNNAALKLPGASRFSHVTL